MPGASWRQKLRWFSTPPISRRRCGISRRSIPISRASEGGRPSRAARGAARLRRADALDRRPAGLGPCRAQHLAPAGGGGAVDGAGRVPGAHRRAAARRRPVRRQDAVRPQPRHRHRRGPHRLRRPARARRRGGHRHADPGQGHRPVDGRDLPDVRPRPARHHARPRSRPGGRGAAPEEAAQAARRKAASQNRRAWRPWRSAAALLLWHYRRNMPDWGPKPLKTEAKAK